MKNKISIFVMNTQSPIKENIGNELSEYLQQLNISIAYWTQNNIPTKVLHRSGDELVVVCSGYATAYTLAFYLSRIWKFSNHPPCFGLSFGDIEQDVNTINIETWIHPLMEQAKTANAFINQQQNKKQFHFKLLNSADNESLEAYSSQFELLFNTILDLQQEQKNEQTEIQSLVCSLYFLLGRQNKVSKYLGRTTSTVSSHMKNGKTDIILKAFHHISEVLNRLEEDQSSHQNDELQTNLRQNITSRLQDYFPQK